MNGSARFTPEAAVPDLWWTLIRSAGMLCIVLAVLIVFLYILKRYVFSRAVNQNRNAIQVLASHHVAPRQRVVLLDVLGEKILIGVTPQHINRLAVIRSGEKNETASSHADLSFDGVLRKTVDGS